LEINTLFNERFGLELTFSQISNKIKYLGLKNGIKTCFRHGNRPPSTAFKPGHISWHTSPSGTERITKNGYVAVKVGRQWIHKHCIIWENAHGPISKGYAILYADSNKLNCVLDNLLLVSYAERAVMNSHDLISSDPELTKTGLQVAKLKLLVGKRVRKLKEKGITA
jgi:hypothetical protein